MSVDDLGMSVDDLGPVRMPEESVPFEPLMPMIPIKPNAAIPVVIGLLLILGGLILAYSAYSNFSGPIEGEKAAQFAEGFRESGVNVTEQEITDYYGALDDEGYYTTLGIIESLAAITLLCSGVMLIRCMRLGVMFGIIGGGLVVLDAVANLIILNSVEPPDPIISMTLSIMGAICLVCGLLCTALPLMPMLITSGRAALLPALDVAEGE